VIDLVASNANVSHPGKFGRLIPTHVDALFSLFGERGRREKMSGMASFHMTSNFNALENIHELSYPINITLPDGRLIVPNKAGVVNLGEGLILKKVPYTAMFTCNLISTWQLTRDEKCTITYGDDCCVI